VLPKIVLTSHGVTKTTRGCPGVSGIRMLAPYVLGPVGCLVGSLWIELASHRCNQIPSD